jgi:hypothetical protein
MLEILIIKYKDDEQVFIPRIQQEVKEYKETNPAQKFLNAIARTGFGSYHRRNTYFNPSFGGGNNYNNRNFNNNNNSFF